MLRTDYGVRQTTPTSPKEAQAVGLGRRGEVGGVRMGLTGAQNRERRGEPTSTVLSSRGLPPLHTQHP